MLLDLLINVILDMLVFISSLLPVLPGVPVAMIEASDYILHNFIPQGIDIVIYFLGPSVTWLAGFGMFAISFRLAFNILRFILRYIPFLGIGGD